MTTAPDVTAQYLTYLKLSGGTRGSLDSRRRLYARVERHLGCALVDATEEQLLAWNEWRARRVEDDTRAGELSALRSFYRWAKLFEWRADDPTARVPRPRRKRRVPRPISEDRLGLAIREAEPTRVRPALVLAAFCGLRAMEISSLRAEDFSGGRLVVTGKGGRTRVVPVHPAVRAALAGLPAKGWLFARRDGLPGPVEPHIISGVANRHLHAHGIPDTLHSLRHRFATQVYAASLDIRVTQELLGHASPVTTQMYAAFAPGSAQDAVMALPETA